MGILNTEAELRVSQAIQMTGNRLVDQPVEVLVRGLALAIQDIVDYITAFDETSEELEELEELEEPEVPEEPETPEEEPEVESKPTKKEDK